MKSTRPVTGSRKRSPLSTTSSSSIWTADGMTGRGCQRISGSRRPARVIAKICCAYSAGTSATPHSVSFLPVSLLRVDLNQAQILGTGTDHRHTAGRSNQGHERDAASICNLVVSFTPFLSSLDSRASGRPGDDRDFKSSLIDGDLFLRADIGNSIQWGKPIWAPDAMLTSQHHQRRLKRCRHQTPSARPLCPDAEKGIRDPFGQHLGQ